MTTHIHMIDRDAAVALTRAVRDTFDPKKTDMPDTGDSSIARLRELIIETREQIIRLESELDAIELGGPLPR